MNLGKKTLITQATKTALGVAVSNIEDALIAVRNALNSAVSTVSTNLTREIQNRTSAETGLSNRITTNANAITSLNNTVSGHTTTIGVLNNNKNTYNTSAVLIGTWAGRNLYRVASSLDIRSKFMLDTTNGVIRIKDTWMDSYVADLPSTSQYAYAVLEWGSLRIKHVNYESVIEIPVNSYGSPYFGMDGVIIQPTANHKFRLYLNRDTYAGHLMLEGVLDSTYRALSDIQQAYIFYSVLLFN